MAFEIQGAGSQTGQVCVLKLQRGLLADAV